MNTRIITFVNDVVREAGPSGVFLNTTGSETVEEKESQEESGFQPGGKRPNKGQTKRKPSGSDVLPSPAAKRRNEASSPATVGISKKKEKVELRFIEAQRLVDPFRVQSFFDTLFARKVSITTNKQRLIVDVISTAERDVFRSL